MLTSDWRKEWAQTEIQDLLFNDTKKLFIMSFVKHWNRLPAEAAESPSLEILKHWPNVGLSNLL